MSLKIEPNVPQRGVISGQKKPLGLKQAANLTGGENSKLLTCHNAADVGENCAKYGLTMLFALAYRCGRRHRKKKANCALGHERAEIPQLAVREVIR
jgi:hypothetical protein